MTTETLPASGLAAYIPGLLPLSFLILAAGITPVRVGAFVCQPLA
jgi:hypothetical protein